MSETHAAGGVTLSDSISPVVRKAEKRELTAGSPLAHHVYWRTWSGEFRQAIGSAPWLATPFLVRTRRDFPESVANLHVRMPIAGMEGGVVVANLSLWCDGNGGDAQRLLRRLGEGDSPDEQMRLWFENWMCATLRDRGVAGLLTEFVKGTASKALSKSLVDGLYQDLGLRGKGGLTLVGASPVETLKFSLEFECHVRECPTAVKFRLEAGLVRDSGTQSAPAPHSRMLEDLKAPLQVVIAAYLGQETTLEALGDEAFPEVTRLARETAAALLQPLGLRFGWFSLTPVFAETVELVDAGEWYPTRSAPVSVAYKITAGCVAKGGSGGPHSDGVRELNDKIGAVLATALRDQPTKRVFLEWDRPGTAREAVRTAITRTVRKAIASTGFATLRSLQIDILDAEWVKEYRQITRHVFHVARVAVLPGNVPIDLHYGFRFRVMDMAEEACAAMSQRFPSPEEIHNEVQTKFQTVLYELIREKQDEPLKAGLSLRQIGDLVNENLAPPGLGLVVRLEDLVRFPTEVERYHCDVKMKSLLARIEEDGLIVAEYRSQRLRIEKDMAQLVGAGLRDTSTYRQKQGSLSETVEELARRERALNRSQDELGEVKAHLRMIEEAQHKGAGVDGTRPVPDLEEDEQAADAGAGSDEPRR